MASRQVTAANIQRLFTDGNIARLRATIRSTPGVTATEQGGIEDVLQAFEQLNQSGWDGFHRGEEADVKTLIGSLNAFLSRHAITLGIPGEGPVKKGKADRAQHGKGRAAPKGKGGRKGAAKRKTKGKAGKPPARCATLAKRPVEADPPEEVKVFRRFLQLVGKGFPKQACELQLRTLQKLIADRKIRRSSRWADDVMKVQRALIERVDSNAQIEVAPGYTDRLRGIVNDHRKAPSVLLLKAFIALIGRPPKARAERLLARYAKYHLCKSHFAEELLAAQRILQAYVAGATDSIAPDGALSLRGLQGICGLECAQGLAGIRGNSPVGAQLVAAMEFDTLTLQPPFDGLIGRPADPFRLLIHGLPGSGKTTLAYRIAGSLAGYNGRRVLIVSAEEGIGYQAQRRLRAMRLGHPNIDLAANLPGDLARYDAVVLDSVTSMALSPQDLRELYHYYPQTSWVLVSQSTKAGTARGSLEYEHDVDTTIRCEGMVARAIKNRFGGMRPIRIEW